MELTRRKMLGAVAAGSCLVSSCMREEVKTAALTTGADAAWPYHELDPERTANLAYGYYPEGQCMYAVFRSIVGQLADQYGEPYRSFPYRMMAYGTNGVMGYGSLCGALNGAAAAISLFEARKEQRASLTGQVFLWYEQTELPVYAPATPKVDMLMPVTVAGSVLCHLSVGNWTKVSVYPAKGKERTERCSRLAADVARQTVLVLNAHLSGADALAIFSDKQVSQCNACHGPNGQRKDVAATMSCGSCHSSLPDTHPEISSKAPKVL
ncbi:MAG: C-GCAxxG-C-C family protein [Phycisphaerae bacterium]|nr:C-GCAxxG-C-C family protein [Phycisphaerae bacterium]